MDFEVRPPHAFSPEFGEAKETKFVNINDLNLSTAWWIPDIGPVAAYT